MAISEQKRQLRQNIKAQIKSNNIRSCKPHDCSIFKNRDHVVGSYFAMGHELDLSFLHDELWFHDQTLAFPHILKQESHKMLFLAWKKEEPLVDNHYQIKQPTYNKTKIVLPDILLLPGLGFDLKGNRLGRGAGYYDRYVANIRKQKSVIAVGVCDSRLVVEDIPVEPHDQAMDMLLTEKGLIPIS